MPAIHSSKEITTLEEYELLSEDIKAEIFENEIYYIASPSEIHQTLIMQISYLLNAYVLQKNGPCKVLPAPFDVKLSDRPLTIVQPDIIVICDKNKLDGKRCNGAPDFIIEIVSPNNSSHDYIKKLYYYEQYGVREYWIVNPMHKTIDVNFFEKEIFSLQYTFDNTIKVNIYDDLYIDFSKINF